KDRGVRIGAHEAAGRLELASYIAIIVDLAVEGDHVATIGRMHRLRAAGAEVDDGKPALAESDAAFGVNPDVSGIRAAMPYRLDHGFADCAQCCGRGRCAPIDQTGNAAHR